MNVILCSSDNNRFSGAFLCLVELCKYLLQKTDIKVKVLLPCEGSGTQLLERENIPYVTIRSYPWIVPLHGTVLSTLKAFCKCVLNIIAVLRIAKYVICNDIDIIHCNSTWTFVGIVAARLCRKKSIWHLREVMWLSQDLKPFLPFSVAKSLYSNITIGIAVSQYVKKIYYDKYGEFNITCIYDGVDVSRFYMPHRSILQYDPVQILMVNAIYPGKGQAELLCAISKLPLEFQKRIVVTFVGDNQVDKDYTNKLYHIIQAEGLQIQVRFVGAVKDVESYYGSSDISVICSRFEAFGRATIESMLSGNIVIGCNSGATKEIIKDKETGMLYVSGNTQSLADKISFCLQHPGLSNQIADFGRRAALQYSVENNGKAMTRLYKEL